MDHNRLRTTMLHVDPNMKSRSLQKFRGLHTNEELDSNDLPVLHSFILFAQKMYRKCQKMHGH
jgi:hypothetical protein